MKRTKLFGPAPSRVSLLFLFTSTVWLPFCFARSTACAQEIIPLYSSQTNLEPATRFETDEALVTRIGDRVRDRHAREPGGYDHYLSWYWEERTVAIELVDQVAKGGKGILVNIRSLAPLNQPDFRCFFRGLNTVAEYHHNAQTRETGTNTYSTRIEYNPKEGRPIQIGDRMEFEFSPFLLAPSHGRSNYYGTTLLYVVGKGIVPWFGKGDRLDSHPIPPAARPGGQTTLPVQYSSEPRHHFKQLAGNISPASVQEFMLGRRLHHTDFHSGRHSEQPNPNFERQKKKLGPRYFEKSCVACHESNGRSHPPETAGPIRRAVIKIAEDASGHPHPLHGTAMQTHSINEEPGPTGPQLLRYETIDGNYGDGTPYQLRRPVYEFPSAFPRFYSIRTSPQLVGLGLLEAIPETDIQQRADPLDKDRDGISGKTQIVRDPETGQPRLGRFGYKAIQPTIRHQVAGALNKDMGITSSLFPTLDDSAVDSQPELSEKDLGHLTRYISVLGVPASRGFASTDFKQGRRLFSEARCNACHVKSWTTSRFHPLAELRNQRIQPYTDLLLHDLGPDLADNLGEGNASGSEWRTAPLWSIGLTNDVTGRESYLHDGRARNLAEAILWHGGEAKAAREVFRRMSRENRKALLVFLKSI
ncbi:MAG: di-heme oxidoredictase family protein [Planctomycetota bacterium]|nr:di-heme oxidoredictase family protein [Planctomycetota bacterium]